MTETSQDTFELHCDRCSYLLRGLPSTGVCPECGHSVEASIIAERRSRFEDMYFFRPPPVLLHPPLELSSRAWLFRVKLGVGITIAAYLILGLWDGFGGQARSWGWGVGETVFAIAMTMYGIATILVGWPERGFRSAEGMPWVIVSTWLCTLAVETALTCSVVESQILIERDARQWADRARLLALLCVPQACFHFYRIAFIATGAPRSRIGRFAYIPALLAGVCSVRIWTAWPRKPWLPDTSVSESCIGPLWAILPVAILVYVLLLLKRVKPARAGTPSGSTDHPGGDAGSSVPTM